MTTEEGKVDFLQSARIVMRFLLSSRSFHSRLKLNKGSRHESDQTRFKT